jgi:two-component system nitrate/nitrite response regulator NarL
MRMNGVLFVGSQLCREGLKALLANPGFSLIGEAATLAEAHHLLCATQVEDERAQILLVELEDRHNGDERELLRVIRRAQPAVKVIALGDTVSLGLFSQTCPTEIDGYLLKDMSGAALMHALDLIMSGQRIFPCGSHHATRGAHALEVAPICAKATIGLSAREAQVLQLLLVGLSNKVIARELAISSETVKVHMKALLRKLNARNRTQAALRAIEHGVKWIGPPPLDDRQSLGQDEPHFPLAESLLAPADDRRSPQVRSWPFSERRRALQVMECPSSIAS